MFGRRGEGAISSHRSAASRQDHERDALFAAAERKELAAQKFEEWVRFKDSFDRGLALFAKLDSCHCEVREPRTREVLCSPEVGILVGNMFTKALRICMYTYNYTRLPQPTRWKIS